MQWSDPITFCGKTYIAILDRGVPIKWILLSTTSAPLVDVFELPDQVKCALDAENPQLKVHSPHELLCI